MGTRTRFARGLSIAAVTMVFMVALLLMTGMAPTAQAQESTGTIMVTGIGEVLLEPDIATVFVTVSTTEPEMRTALAQNTAATEDVIDALVALGVESADITTSSFWTQPEISWRDVEPQVVGHTASHTLRVVVRDIDKLGDALVTATEAGATSVGNILLSVEDIGDAYSQALTLAVRSARVKADVIAEAADATIDGIISISEQVGWNNPSVVARAPADAAGGSVAFAVAESSVPFQAGDFAVRAEVWVVYAIS